MANINKPTSPYSRTPIKDYYLDLWQPVDIPASANDTEIEIQPQHHERPDLLSYELYGTARLWWLFAMRNKDVLFDPIYDFKSGTKIFIPSKDRIEELI